MTKEPRITIRLSPARALLLAQNIDGWVDAGACEGGLTPDEREALQSAESQIRTQLGRIGYRGGYKR